MSHPDPIAFIHECNWSDLPADAQVMTRLNLLDLTAIAAAAQTTRLTELIAAHAAHQFAGVQPMLFDPRSASAAGVALAAGMRIDSLDGHDGFNPAKGHIGCPLLPALLALAPADLSGGAFLTALAMGYEFGARASVAQHATAPDYHTSGSWGAVTAAAAGARLLKLDSQQTRHALGIAEYHGPRSQMMRCIDHPTMVKDGSGWGAMAGVSAALLAQSGFTGAPSLITEQAQDHWGDLGARWYVSEQYYKPWPVCRWVQGPVEALLALRSAHGVAASDVASIEIETFHEAVRLATASPKTTEEAQYSTSFPCALALVHGDIRPEHLRDEALQESETLRLSQATVMREHAHANAYFPQQRFARVSLGLRNGARLKTDWIEPRWGPQNPPRAADLEAKYRAYATPILGPARAEAIETTIATLETRPYADLGQLLMAPT
ncbi:MmgE/PrpD family protein [Rhodobacteraceae bacterium D3-12]|nr:MmgE/PrpD family protein [Rhodobacteraceae bacterium D3-12]